jgi:hypothetical protein
MFARAPSVARTGGRRRAVRMLDRALEDAQQLTTIRDGETLGAETFGLPHLMGAHFAARDRDAAAAADHLDEACRVALLTGERNGLQPHRGCTLTSHDPGRRPRGRGTARMLCWVSPTEQLPQTQRQRRALHAPCPSRQHRSHHRRHLPNPREPGLLQPAPDEGRRRHRAGPPRRRLVRDHPGRNGRH